jgi:SAM-dependent methyltransferase
MLASLRPLLLRAWFARAKLHRRLKRRDIAAHRSALIGRLAPGKSFLDMGGMWSVHGEMSFLAEAAGARRVVLCDAMDPTDEFERRKTAQRSRVEFVQGDLHDPGTIEALGQFDVVWCTGVIYHSPDPYRLIEHLRELTLETLVLGTRVLPELRLFEGGCVFYPALSARSRRAIGWLHGSEAKGLVGAATPFDRTPVMGLVNYWWGLTPSAVRGMLDVARFDVVEEWNEDPLVLELVAAAREQPSVLPALDFARLRGSERSRD